MPLCIYFVADDVLLFACCLVEKRFISPKQGARIGLSMAQQDFANPSTNFQMSLVAVVENSTDILPLHVYDSL